LTSFHLSESNFSQLDQCHIGLSMFLLVFSSLPFSTFPDHRPKPGIIEQLGRIFSDISAIRNLAVNILFYA